MTRTVVFLAALTLSTVSCSDIGDHYAAGLDDPEAIQLLDMIEDEDDPVIRAAAIERISEFMFRDASPERLISYLTTIVEQHPEDPFGALYLYIVGQAYLERDAGELARHYFERVVNGYADVEFKGVSIHRAAMEQLVLLTPDAERRAGYYRVLADSYADQVDIGLVNYRLARSYEEYGAWEQAYDAYRVFLVHPETEVPGEPDAHRIVSERVEFFDSGKNWTVPALEDLRAAIAWSISTKNVRSLLRFRAGVNFFTRTWEQDPDDPNTEPEWELGDLLLHSRYISVSGEAELDSDADEAYLFTYGWGLRIKTWYLYFRKVHYPPDPEIHGNWEWAGIYLGERVQSTQF
jgi:hypothetical protein